MPGNNPGSGPEKAATLAEGAPRRGRGTIFASLSYREFRLLWLGQATHSISLWSESVARNWLTWELTHSALALGIVNVARAIPLLAFGVLGGVVADRFDKRKVLILCQTLTLASYVFMAVLIQGHLIRLWHIYITAFALGTAMAFNQPVRNAWIPQLVHEKDLINAVSLNAVAVNATRMVGPAATGLVIGVAGTGMAYIVAAVVYVFVIAVTGMMKRSSPRVRTEKISLFGDLTEGFRFALAHKVILALLVVALAPLTLGVQYMILLPVFADRVLHTNALGFGILQSAAGVGAVAGGFAVAALGDFKAKGRAMLVGAMAFGLLLPAMAVARWFPLAFLVLMGIGAAGTAFRSINNTILLQITPPGLQGRVISLTMLDTGLQPLVSVMSGAMTEVTSVSWTLTVLGAMCLLVVSTVAVAQPKLRNL